MSMVEDHLDEMYYREEQAKEARKQRIIDEFKDLTLEEKVDRLIEIYARNVVNKY